MVVHKTESPIQHDLSLPLAVSCGLRTLVYFRTVFKTPNIWGHGSLMFSHGPLPPAVEKENQQQDIRKA